MREIDDPGDLEVHPAIEVPGARGRLPSYVDRAHDEVLRARVRQVVDTGRSAVAVLVGGSSTGKTRACWEVLQMLPDDWRVWHPIEPGRPESVVDAVGDLSPRTLVWLNETHHYLLTPGSSLGEEVSARLRALLRDPARAPVVVLGTIWPEYWAELTTTPSFEQDGDRPKPDMHAQARALLVDSGIPVPDSFDGSALGTLRSTAWRDPRLAHALSYAEDGRITQYLAGVPALLERYDNAPVAARAVVDAALDARRLGHGVLLSHEYLQSAAPHYIVDDQWDLLPDDWLADALRYTGAPCRGSRGPLTRVRARPGRAEPDGHRYRVADYLEQAGGDRAVPDGVWEALTAHAPLEDLPRIGLAARRASVPAHAARIYARLAEAGDADALFIAADQFRRAHGADHAIAWLRERAVGGDPRAARGAADLLHKTGRAEEAVTWYRFAADAGDAISLHTATELLVALGREDEALRWLGALGPTAARLGGDMLRHAGRLDEAVTWYRRAAEAGDPQSTHALMSSLLRLGHVDEAVAWLRRRHGEGDGRAARLAAYLLLKAGRPHEAAEWGKLAEPKGSGSAEPTQSP